MRLSTGSKLTVIMAALLMPLGLIALFASVESARSNQIARQTATRLVAQESASRLSAAVGRLALTLRATATALSLSRGGADTCRVMLDQLSKGPAGGGRVALFDPHGHLLCASPAQGGALPLRPRSAASASGDYQAAIAPDKSGLAVAVRGATDTSVAVGVLPAGTLSAIATPATRGVGAPVQITLSGAGGSLALLREADGEDKDVAAAAPVAGGQLLLALAVHAPPLRPVEILLMLLPIVMLIAAAVIGWLVVDRMLVRPLMVLERAMADYRPGTALPLPAITTPATEIRRLRRSFSRLTGLVQRHEAELEAGLARQTRLTREVHHRVKNNLQVVASLINLHARSAQGDESRDAYAAILRRVDALAIVHRNHYAEYEQNKGVALRPLIQELAGNLRGSAGAGRFSVAVAIDPLHVTQDTAVAVAFLVTEAVELALLDDPAGLVAIRLARAEEGHALLSITSPVLRDPGERLGEAVALRFGRVVEGLARQLRSKLDRDPANGRYSLLVAVLD